MHQQLPWNERLRLARTLFVHRWHAAQTVGESFGNESVGERFEHINHVRSLAQYVWRCGAFCENAERTGRIAVPHAARSLRAIVKPVAAKGRGHFERAVRYAAWFGGRAPTASVVQADPDLAALLRYAAEHADIRAFARELAELHRAMLRYYVQMRYLTPTEAEAFRRGRIPLLTPPEGDPASSGGTRRWPAVHGSASRRPVRGAPEHHCSQHPPCPRLPGSHRVVSDPVGPPPREWGCHGDAWTPITTGNHGRGASGPAALTVRGP